MPHAPAPQQSAPAGKWHNRALGMTMRVEKSTAEQVRNRLEEVKKAKQGGGGGSGADYAPDGEKTWRG